MTLEFHAHTDLWDEYDLSTNAALTFQRCGNWTARNAADGIVPPDVPWQIDYTPEQITLDPSAAIAELVDAGLWTPLPAGGWRMERGPSDEWTGQMPLWRYSAHLEGVELEPDFTIFPDPDD
jgi:hypothetical protein